VSTNSTISIIKEDDSVETIYCHNDGYIEYNGAILFLHYKDKDKIKGLIDLGDISSLGKEIIPKGKHSFDNREADITVSYYRDRGEDKNNTRAKVFASLEHYLNSDLSQEYDYLYNLKNKKWYFVNKNMNLNLLEIKVKKCKTMLVGDLKEEFYEYEKNKKIIKEYNFLNKNINKISNNEEKFKPRFKL